MHDPIGQAQFVVFDILTSAYYLKLQEKSCYYLLLMYVKKRHRVKKDEILKAYTLLVICTGVTILHSSRYNFALLALQLCTPRVTTLHSRYNFALLALQLCTPRVTILHSSRYNFALVLQDELVFSQSKAGNFFMYIIVKEIFHAFSIFSPNLT